MHSRSRSSPNNKHADLEVQQMSEIYLVSHLAEPMPAAIKRRTPVPVLILCLKNCGGSHDIWKTKAIRQIEASCFCSVLRVYSVLPGVDPCIGANIGNSGISNFGSIHRSTFMPLFITHITITPH